MNQKTVLITGSTGFIGQRLVSKLLDNGYEVIAVTRNPNSFPSGSLPAFCNINDYESILMIMKVYPKLFLGQTWYFTSLV